MIPVILTVLASGLLSVTGLKGWVKLEAPYCEVRLTSDVMVMLLPAAPRNPPV
ncbi:MAG: hypothetical protein QOE93_2499, partial [Actinomycetota bacterium]|nr:hypothetical protein [Actinomycetota bacterium]